MKKLVVLLLVMTAVGAMASSPALTHAQSPSTGLKPTFISPTPGLYVNGWPAFTVSYPKEWVELVPGLNGVLRVGVPRPDLPSTIHLPSFNVGTGAFLLPLEDAAKIFIPVYARYAADIKVLSDKPSQLKDGTPAREVEIEYLRKNDPKLKLNDFILVTNKEASWVWVIVSDDKGRIGEDVKKYVYTLTLQPDREEPVPVPPDVRTFFDMWCADNKSHDVKALMSHFSDRFLHGGYNRAYLEQAFQNDPLSPAKLDVTSCNATVTLFEARGDRAYVDGFFLLRAKADVKGLRIPMMWQQIIREQGQWKWFGNQK